MNARFSIRILLAVVFMLSIAIAFTVYRVDTQRHAVRVIGNCNGSAFHKALEINQSFSNNLRYSVTTIEIPRVESSTVFADAIDSLPNLERIEITLDYDTDGMVWMRSRFPHLEIEHSFDPLIDLIQ